MDEEVRLLDEARRAARREGVREFDDLVQETLLRVWEQVRRTGRAERTSRLVQTTLRRLRIDGWRRKAPEISEGLDDLPGSDRGPLGRASASEWRRMLQRRVRTLPPPQREAVRLRFFEGRSFAEIAERQGVPKGTALARVHQAVRRLRRELEAFDDVPE